MSQIQGQARQLSETLSENKMEREVAKDSFSHKVLALCMGWGLLKTK